MNPEKNNNNTFFTFLPRTGSTEAEIGRESHHPNLRGVAHLFVVLPISVGQFLTAS
jgi:hypothetical protein